MSTTTFNPDATETPGTPRPIAFGRLVAVEARKSFDTRAGAWLMGSVAIIAVLATLGTALWTPDDSLNFESFATALALPMSVLLPVIGLLAVTSEYSQRTALTTYAWIPHRGRVLTAKYVVVLIAAVTSMAVSLAVGAVGNLFGAGANGVDPVWNIGAQQMAMIVLAQTIGMSMGFMLGVLLRNSPAAIVAFFVYLLVIPGIFGALAAFQDWFADIQPWIDLNLSVARLSDRLPTGEHWAQLGLGLVLWLVLPLAIGLRATIRAEVK